MIGRIEPPFRETNEESVAVRALPLHKAPEKKGRMAMTYGGLIAVQAFNLLS